MKTRTRNLSIGAILVVALVVGAFFVYLGSYGEPTIDSSSPSGFYVPKDLQDALVELDRIMGDRGRRETLEADSESKMSMHHLGVGMWMRNAWGLWGGESPLSAYFHSLGIFHPDDMSGIVLDSYWRTVHGKPVDLEGQVEYYKRYWDSNGQKQAPDS